MTIPFINVKVSLGVLLGYVVTAAIATPSVGIIVDDLITGKPVPVTLLEAAGVGLAGFLANTLIHQKTQSSGPNAQSIAALHAAGYGPNGLPLPTPAPAAPAPPVVASVPPAAAPAPAAPVVPPPVV